MAARVDQVERGRVAVGAADGERASFRAEREPVQGADKRTAEPELAAAGEARPDAAAGRRVEERDGAVVASKRERFPVRGERFVEQSLDSGPEHSQRRRAAEQR